MSDKLDDLIERVQQGEPLPIVAGEEISSRRLWSGQIVETDEVLHCALLEAMPIRVDEDREWFAIGEAAIVGSEPLMLLWWKKGRYFARYLTRKETDELCTAVGITRSFW